MGKGGEDANFVAYFQCPKLDVAIFLNASISTGSLGGTDGKYRTDSRKRGFLAASYSCGPNTVGCGQG
jgi:hypothetical protein